MSMRFDTRDAIIRIVKSSGIVRPALLLLIPKQKSSYTHQDNQHWIFRFLRFFKQLLSY